MSFLRTKSRFPASELPDAACCAELCCNMACVADRRELRGGEGLLIARKPAVSLRWLTDRQQGPIASTGGAESTGAVHQLRVGKHRLARGQSGQGAQPDTHVSWGGRAGSSGWSGEVGGGEGGAE